MSKLSITAIVLTYNEELHLQRCLDKILPLVESVVIVDSFSTDGTEAIALKNKVKFIQNKWVNYAEQFNWGIHNSNIKTDWILRLDADEYLSPELQVEVIDKFTTIDTNVNGIVFPRKHVFLDKTMNRGLGAVQLLRLFKTGFGECENRWMDEHIQLTEGNVIECENIFLDHNLNDISWWATKHIGYAIREAIDLLDIELNLIDVEASGALSTQANTKRQLKLKYAKKPLFIRSFAYFVYRYIFRLGFTDGAEGFLWHFMQGWWYRTLVDVKVYEIKKACGTDKEKIKAYLKAKHGINI